MKHPTSDHHKTGDDLHRAGDEPTRLGPAPTGASPGNVSQEATVPVKQAADEPPVAREPMRKEAPAREEPRRPAAPAVPVAAESGGHTRVLIPASAQPVADNTRIEPVVGWLVVVDGPGQGSYRTIYYGSNTIGRGEGQRIRLDFGDTAISGSEHAYLVYDSRSRGFQIAPNLGRQNIIRLNDDALVTPQVLKPNDRITIGETTLLFVPLCGSDFEWASAG
jgi:hypothetical protein